MNLSWNDNNWPFTIMVRGGNFTRSAHMYTTGIYVTYSSKHYSAILVTT